MLGEQLLQVLLHAVLLQARVDPEVVGVSCSTSSSRIRSVSPSLPVTSHSGTPSSLVPSATLQGGDIQFSGL